ncbi:MAG: response regulator transcription factor [Ignavibacteriales bacterium]|nr:response regulator transcription factor [Ignavibacteriales bacterium]
MSKPKQIRILLVDDHPIVLSGLRNALSTHPRFEIVGEASDGMKAVELAKEHQPDIVLMDISLPGMNGLEATKVLKKEVKKSKVVILTMHDNKEYVLEIIRCGAWGYLLKDTSPAELARAIERIYKGETFFSPSVSQIFIDSYVKQSGKIKRQDVKQLTQRETRIVSLFGYGLGRKEIAHRMRLSVRTVDSYRWRIMKKLRMRRVADLIRFAIKEGFVDVR